MRQRDWIGLLAAVMVLGACAATSAQAPGSDSATAAPGGAEQTKADRDAKFVPEWWDSGKIPHFYLRSARRSFFGNRVSKTRDAARNDLRLLVLQKSKRFVAENRAYMVRERWQPEFIEEFDRIVNWHQSLWEGDGKQAYDQGRDFLSRGGMKSNQYVGKQLLFLAGSLGYFQGLVDYANIYLDGNTESDRSRGRFWLREVAELGFAPAQREIGERYSEGRGYGPSKAKALYWLGRAAMAGAEVESQIQALKQEISPTELVQVLKWISIDVPPRE